MIKDNVIELPVKNRLLKIKNTLRLRFDLEQRKIVASASILSILFLVAVVNDRILSRPEASHFGSRGLASYMESSKLVRDTAWEAQMARELSLEAPEIRDATFASRASPLDQFEFGLLEGKYTLHLYRGRIQGAEFSEKNQAVNPTLITDRAHFLMQSRSLWPERFEQAIRTKSQVSGGEQRESFDLVDRQQKRIAQVNFCLDAFGRLLSLQVTESE